MTGDAIVDRVRSLCVAAPFFYREAVEVFSFDRDPSQALQEPIFRIEPLESQYSIGQSGYREDRVDLLRLWVARDVGADYDATRRAILRDVHSLTAVIVRDAHVTSGDYGILDEGKDSTVQAERGAQFMTLRLTLPVQYEVSL